MDKYRRLATSISDFEMCDILELAQFRQSY